MDQLLIGNLDLKLNVAIVCLGWHLEGEALILHSSFRQYPATIDLAVIPVLTELRQLRIPFINTDQLGTVF